MKLVTAALILGLSTLSVATVSDDGRPAFRLDALTINEENLQFTTLYEEPSQEFTVEQYIYKQWHKINQFFGSGDQDTTIYTAHIAPNLHSGTNTFRIRHSLDGVISFYSDPVTVNSNVSKSHHFRKKDSFLLSRRQYYKVYDDNGVLLRNAWGSVVDISTLSARGTYFLCYDNQVVEFRKGLRRL